MDTSVANLHVGYFYCTPIAFNLWLICTHMQSYKIVMLAVPVIVQELTKLWLLIDTR